MGKLPEEGGPLVVAQQYSKAKQRVDVSKGFCLNDLPYLLVLSDASIGAQLQNNNYFVVVTLYENPLGGP